VYIGGAFFGVSGTSASAPVIAAFFSNVNAARMDIGKGTIGWINPVLYSNRTFFINDIVSGHNTCGASGICCPHGFTATAGWDPATGLGSVDYAKLLNTLIKFGVSRSVAPTYSPTPAPTKGKFSLISVTQV
jgi:tripeptidyl-peptidase I